MIKSLRKLAGALLLSTMASGAWAQLAVPYSMDFSTITSATDFVDSDWTVLDASEKTGKTWGTGTCYTDNGYINDMVTAKDYSAAYNDYLISPAITLEAGKTYEVKTLTALLSSLDMTLTLELGTSNTDTASFTTLADLTPEEKGYNADATKTTEFTVEADGTYYLAIRAKGETAGSSARAHAFSFAIEEKAGSETPDTPADTTVALPYTADFQTAADGWTTISGSAEDSWTYVSDYGFYDKTAGKFYADVKLKSGNETPDYYVSPAFNLEAGKTYIVNTLAAFNNTKGALDVALAIGTSAADSTSFTTVKTLAPFTNTFSEDSVETTTFTVDSTGVYHLAFVGKTADAELSTIAHLFSFSIDEFVLKAPYSMDFSTITSATDFIDSEWTVLDASEKTGKTWGPGQCYTDNGYVNDMVTAKDYSAAYNDYLISPAIKLEAGKTYEVKTLTALLSSLDMTLTLELGTTNTDTASFKTLADLTPEEKGYNADATKTTELAVDSTGMYFLAIRAKGETAGSSARAHAFSFAIAEKKASDPEETEETVALPYGITFFTEPTEGWTTISGTDNDSWTYEPDYGFYDKTAGKFYADVKLKSGNATPDLYVSPAFYLEAGKDYTVRTLAAFNNTKGALDLSLAIGKSHADSTAFTTLKTLTPFTDTYTENNEATAVTVEESGVYHFAFVGKTTDADKSTIAHLFLFVLTEGTPDAIRTIGTESNQKTNAIYNLCGQKVSHATKGIFIINGKKVLK